ncbi:hypothetical protein [Burkholderia cepacia]|uniref:Uncharacterized protein n=1 Tax=Burkholderia cepacia GG4 TaxID=1009846 RepID=A0A9W3PCG5_BURCE|nr:hypothetical protein [Burkholderia cepacia]AFQ51630.1 hypothetical protein GEM_5245 [Burkholderia cepacia GG4]
MFACSGVSSRSGSFRTTFRSTYRSVSRAILLSAVVLSAFSVGPSARAQSLFIGDAGDNSVKQFNASGAYLDSFVAPAAAGLDGPRGMIFTDGQLVVVNQNLNATASGEILRFDDRGTFVGKLVASSDRHAPFAPRGIVRGGPGNQYYVADIVGGNGCAAGNVKEYNNNGAFVGSLTPNPQVFTDVFHPRGVVFGPDGLLYVSASGCLDTPTDPLFNPVTGYILRFNAANGKFVDVFASNATVPNLHRPEGLVFDNAGHLWVTSFRANPNDSDRILELDGKTGTRITEIPLSTPPGARAFAQAIVLGPHNTLYIPITGGDSTTTGQVWRCSTTATTTPVPCDIIVKSNSAGGPLLQPWYPIFRNSDPATLKYNED